MYSIADPARLDPDDTDVDAMDDHELAAVPDGRIEEAFARTHLRIERLEVRRMRLLAEVDRRRSFERDGYLSASAWLAGAFRFAHTSARKLVGLARGLCRMPHTREVLEGSEISGSAFELLVRAREVDPPVGGGGALGATCTNACAHAGTSTHRSCSTGWCAWTASSITNAGNTCSPPSAPSSTRRPTRATHATHDRRRSGASMPSKRSAAGS